MWASVKDIASDSSKYIYNAEEKNTYFGLENSTAKLFNENTIVITARGTC